MCLIRLGWAGFFKDAPRKTLGLLQNEGVVEQRERLRCDVEALREGDETVESGQSKTSSKGSTTERF